MLTLRSERTLQHTVVSQVACDVETTLDFAALATYLQSEDSHTIHFALATVFNCVSAGDARHTLLRQGPAIRQLLLEHRNVSLTRESRSLFAGCVSYMAYNGFHDDELAAMLRTFARDRRALNRCYAVVGLCLLPSADWPAIIKALHSPVKSEVTAALLGLSYRWERGMAWPTARSGHGVGHSDLVHSLESLLISAPTGIRLDCYALLLKMGEQHVILSLIAALADFRASSDYRRACDLLHEYTGEAYYAKVANGIV